MLSSRSGPLAAWGNAWLAGEVASDEVLRAVTGDDAAHRVIGLDPGAVPISELLIRWRRLGASVRLVLPVPGDVRGVPGPVEFRTAAIAATEAAFAGDLAVVPSVVDHSPSSAPTSVTWAAYRVADVTPEFLSVTDAQYELSGAIREAAGELAAASVAGGGDGLDEALRDARDAGHRLNLPPGFPPRAVALLAQAERMHAVLELARTDSVGGAVDRAGVAARSAALRPVTIAVRRARLAGYNAGATR